MTALTNSPSPASTEAESACPVSRRILFAAMAPPCPATNGQRIRNRNILKVLHAQGHKVSIVCFVEPSEERDTTAELHDLCDRVTYVDAPRSMPLVSQVIARLLALFSPEPHGLKRFRQSAMKAALELELASRTFDVVLCDDVYMLSNTPERKDLPLILNKHDLTFEIVNRFSRIEKNIAKKLYGYLEGWKIKRIEYASAGRADAVWACSARDKAILEAGGTAASVFVVPNAIDTSGCQLEASDDGATILYAGAMDWLPNRDAVTFFIDDIYPKIREAIPEVRFVVAGRNPPAEFCRRFADVPGVRFTGFVKSLKEEFAKSTVCVVPLRIGSGTRLKILEASAAGKPVVSTAIGAEGLGLIPDEDILIADSAEHFAESVVKLLKFKDLRRKMSENAQTKVNEYYGLPALNDAVRLAVIGSLKSTEKDPS